MNEWIDEHNMCQVVCSSKSVWLKGKLDLTTKNHIAHDVGFLFTKTPDKR